MIEPPTTSTRVRAAKSVTPWFAVALAVIAALWMATIMLAFVVHPEASFLFPLILALANAGTVSLVAWGCLSAARRDAGRVQQRFDNRINVLSGDVAAVRLMLCDVGQQLRKDDWNMFAEASAYLAEVSGEQPVVDDGSVVPIRGRARVNGDRVIRDAR